MASKSMFDPFGRYRSKATVSPLQEQYQTYGDSVKSDTSMFDTLTSKYNDLYNTFNKEMAGGGQTYMPNPYKPQTYDYAPSKDYTDAISKLKGLTETGGYSDTDLQALRERGVSPIRAVYAGANRDINRRAALTGGSASFGALKAKMAREQSMQMADALNDVNAGIAEKVAAGKRGAISEYTGAAGSENALRNQYGLKKTDTLNDASKYNTDTGNDASKFNLGLKAQGLSGMQSILDALRALYGTTPARSSLSGSQAMQGSSLRNSIRQGNRSFGLQKLSSAIGGLG